MLKMSMAIMWLHLTYPSDPNLHGPTMHLLLHGRKVLLYILKDLFQNSKTCPAVPKLSQLFFFLIKTFSVGMRKRF